MKKETQETKEKIIKMVQIEIDIENDIIDKIVKFALESIKNDRPALINYGINLMLKEIIETDGKCLKKKVAKKKVE